ncbi:MAG: EF-P lysine aminoacylase GenX [Verrucomicrobia bacterium]|nr:EF-P lysine aminoacylase GenX [Verrucomicrobiota bacterium]MBU6446973.1 EF-P lysine aminoacylase GenX [Verrucomicrobiota bacterium]MDE3046781.1 EF-P lysine aminoacylase GenX [Verrucomicrobiota bacterium]
MSPAFPKAIFLKDRAQMLARARAFFAERDVMEIDVGALVRRAPLDNHIDCIGVDQDNGFLHTSPEYALKRMLASGMGDCYFLGHVFRKGELGHLHNPEFTMVEWYRLGFTFEQMIQETAQFLFLFFGEQTVRHLSYRKAFEQYVGIDYEKEPLSGLHKLTNSDWDRSTCLHYLLSHQIEPKLGRGELTALLDYPPHEAALACMVEKQGEWVAERFEFYFEGVELSNGFHELRDATELAQRFALSNAKRIAEGKAPYAFDEPFLQCLQHLPNCCGVALGFDRALMLKHQSGSIKQVIPFAWDELA